MTRKEINLIWAAGLFDGEGCVWTRWPKRWQGVLQIKMVHKPTLEKFAKAVGCEVKKAYENREGNRKQWQVSMYDNAARRVGALLLPNLCEKHGQVKMLLKFKATLDLKEREYYAKEITRLKKFEFL